LVNLDVQPLKPEETKEKTKKNKSQSAKKKVKIDLVGDQEPDEEPGNAGDILDVIDKTEPQKLLTNSNSPNKFSNISPYTKKTSIENKLMKKATMESP